MGGNQSSRNKRRAGPSDDAFEVRRQLFKTGGLIPDETYDGPGKFVIAAPGVGKFASSPPLELTYFAIRGLGQVPQLCLEIAGYPYRYTVVNGKYFREHMKQQLVFGRLPALVTLGGIEIVQSKAILRYVASVCGLAGKSDDEVARCDMLYEMLQTEGKLDGAEIKKFEGRSSLGEVESLKVTGRVKTMTLDEEEKTRAALQFWEDTVNSSKSGWMLGGLGDGHADNLCYVDVAMYWTLRPHVEILKQLGCVGLAKFVDRAHGLDGIKRLIDSGRLMPNVGEGYVYQADELVPQPPPAAEP